MKHEGLIAALSACQYVIAGNTEGVTHEESLRQPTPAGNCLNWIAGHILATRNTILRIVGEAPFLDELEARPYRRGSSPISAGASCTDFERLRDGLRKTSETIVGELAAMDEPAMEEVLDPGGVPAKLERPTRAALLTLLLFHESYHAGQLGTGRRLLGKEGVIR